jgi:plastocyanin
MRTTSGNRRSRSAWTAAGAALLCWAAASGAIADTPNTIRIDVKNFMFGPNTLTVKAGSTVTWTNMDQEPHTVVSETGLFRSGAIDTSESFSFKFQAAGTYHYVCTIHPRMVGTVVVE